MSKSRMSRTARLHRAAPALLTCAMDRAAELSHALRLLVCTGPEGMVPCVHCAMRQELEWILDLIGQVDADPGPRR